MNPPGSAASLPAHLHRAWDAAAQVIWLALGEDDRAYDIAADVVKTLDERGHIGGAA